MVITSLIVCALSAALRNAVECGLAKITESLSAVLVLVLFTASLNNGCSVWVDYMVACLHATSTVDRSHMYTTYHFTHNTDAYKLHTARSNEWLHIHRFCHSIDIEYFYLPRSSIKTESCSHHYSWHIWHVCHSEDSLNTIQIHPSHDQCWTPNISLVSASLLHHNRNRRLHLFGHFIRSRSVAAAIQKPPSNWKWPIGRPSHTWLCKSMPWKEEDHLSLDSTSSDPRLSTLHTYRYRALPY